MDFNKNDLESISVARAQKYVDRDPILGTQWINPNMQQFHSL